MPAANAIERIRELDNLFYNHPAVKCFEARLIEIGHGYAEIEMPMKPAHLMRCDMKPGQIIQGGVTGGVLMDFGGVVAAMTVVTGHTALIDLHAHYIKPAFAGIYRIRAEVARIEKDRRIIIVGATIYEKLSATVIAGGAMAFKVAKDTKFFIPPSLRN